MRVLGQAKTTCISLQVEIVTEVIEENAKGLEPVIHLKFAAHGFKFLKKNFPSS